MEVDRVSKCFCCFPGKGVLLRLASFGSNSSKTNSSSTSPNSGAVVTAKAEGKAREQELRQVFRHFDGDNDGKISALELRSYFAKIGEYMSQEESQAVILELDTDKDSFIDFGDFMRLMMDKEGEEEEKDVKAAFEMFEDEKGSGRICPKSLQRALSKLGDPTSYDDCVHMIGVIDKHGKGALDFHDFQQMMMP